MKILVEAGKATFRATKSVRPGVSARSSSSINLDAAIAKTLAASAMKNRPGHLRSYTLFERLQPVVGKSITGIAQQVGYEVAFEMILDLFIDVNAKMAQLDDPGLEEFWQVLRSEFEPSAALSRLYSGANQATDVSATDGILYAGVIISVLTERRRRGKPIPDSDLGAYKVGTSNGKTVLSLGKKMIGTVSDMAKDPITFSYIAVAAIGSYEGATGENILPEGDLDLDAGFFESKTGVAQKVIDTLDDVGESLGLAPDVGNPLKAGYSIAQQAVVEAAGTLDRVRKAGQIVGAAAASTLTSRQDRVLDSQDIGLRDSYDSVFKKVASQFTNVKVKSVF